MIALYLHVDSTNMQNECGNTGLISLAGKSLPVEVWEINHAADTAKVYVSGRCFDNQYLVATNQIVNVIGLDWQLRLDNEEHIFHSFARCEGVARPNLKIPNPTCEYFSRDLVLHFSFLYGSYGPYKMCEAKAMARNGNSIFFDLLPISELERLYSSGRDARFCGSMTDRIN